MKKLLLISTVLASFIQPGSIATAADLDPPPPPVDHLRPATYDWSGGYVGGWVGTACIDGTLTDNVPSPVTFENAGCGFKGGVLVGYNHQMDNIVFGIEGDWGMSNSIVTNNEAGADYTYGLDSIATLRGRVGYAMDDTLFFVTAGGAWARGDLNSITSGTADHLKSDHFGWTIGGGIEHAVTDRFRVKLDYLYTILGDGHYGTPCGACDVDVHWGTEQEVRLGMIYAF
ncbi:MAG: outer membrane beta-barrel protein [Aestuariivirga sp.]